MKNKMILSMIFLFVIMFAVCDGDCKAYGYETASVIESEIIVSRVAGEVEPGWFRDSKSCYMPDVLRYSFEKFGVVIPELSDDECKTVYQAFGLKYLAYRTYLTKLEVEQLANRVSELKGTDLVSVGKSLFADDKVDYSYVVLFARLPKKVQDSLNGWKITTDKSYIVSYMAEINYVGVGIRGLCIPSEKLLVVTRLDTFLHELGHRFDLFLDGKYAIAQEWSPDLVAEYNVYHSDFESGYFKYADVTISDESEFYAEGFNTYMIQLLELDIVRDTWGYETSNLFNMICAQIFD